MIETQLDTSPPPPPPLAVKLDRSELASDRKLASEPVYDTKKSELNEASDSIPRTASQDALSNEDVEEDSVDSDRTSSKMDKQSSPNVDNHLHHHSSDQPIKELSPHNSTLVLAGQRIKTGQLFGPFTDPIQWLAIRHSNKHSLPKEFCSLEPDLLTLFRNIQMANSSDEQNMEIIVKSNKFYFRAMRTIDLEASTIKRDAPGAETVDDQEQVDTSDSAANTIEPLKEKPLFAWFSVELSSRLPTPGASVINGNKRYYCTKCNQVFIYPNPAVLHILFACTNASSASSSSSSVANSNEHQLASPSGRLDNNNNKTSLSAGSSLDSVHTTTSTPKSSPINSQPLTNNTPIINSSSSFSDSPSSYTPLNGSVSLANSKILKNLEAKLCKQFSAQQQQQPPLHCNETTGGQQNHHQNSNNNKQLQSSSGTSGGSSRSSGSKQSKKRAFDIDSLVNNIEQHHSNKKHKSTDSDGHHHSKASSKSTKNEKLFKTPLASSPSSSSKSVTSNDNSTLINTLNSPLVNGLTNCSPFLNPFSLLDPASLASNLPSAFHKVDNNSASSKSSLLNSGTTAGLTAAEHASLLNAAAMFGATGQPNFANPFDLASLYAQHQRNLLQSMFNQQAALNSGASSSGSSGGDGSSNSGLNSYLQSQLMNPLFPSQNFANLSTLNSLNNFNGLGNLLASQPNSNLGSNLSSSMNSNLGSNLSSSLSSSLNSNLAASSLSSGLSPSLASSLFGSLAGSIGGGGQSSASNHSSSAYHGLDQFVVPQPAASGEKASKKKKAKDKDLTNASKSSQSSNSQSNRSSSSYNQNDTSSSSSSSANNNNKLNPLIPPSYLQFLPPSLAALTHPQSNWCAKCYISFRMTSDLVYHMRSQHKESNSNLASLQSSSPTKRKRDENKLFCSICGESFKERHHLSRHMISH